jgi:DNA polymerase III epsilon subunit family exonuclease
VDPQKDLRGEDLDTLRHRAHAYFMAVNRPVPSEELARHLFDARDEDSVSTLMVRTLLGKDRRFHEARREMWELSTSPYRDLPLENASFAVVDLEATGSRRGLDRIIEVGIVRVEGEEIVARYETLVNPLRPIPRWIRGLTGIQEAMLQDAPRFHQVAPEIMQLLGDSVFVAHNVDFDYPFLRHQLREAGHRPDPWPQLCTVRLSRRMHPEWNAFRLGAVAERLELRHDRQHRAVGDAHATARLLLHELRELREHGLSTVGEVLALAWSRGDLASA